MTEELLMFKTKNDRIEVIISHNAEYEDVKRRLFRKLDTLASFFGDNEFCIYLAGKRFSDGQKKEISSIIKSEYVINDVKFCTLEELRNLDKVPERMLDNKDRYVNNEPEVVEEEQGFSRNSVFKVGNVRGGQVIESYGDITVIGDVNPSAELIAKDNICVVGTLRGNVHAGAFGDKEAIIVANVLEAKQIRIAEHVGIAPNDNKSNGVTEIAKIVDGRIVIEPLNDKPKKKKKFFRR